MADDDAYLAMVKADAIKVQSRLDKLSSQIESQAAATTGGGRRSVLRRRREIAAIHRGTAEIDAIIERGGDDVRQVKLGLIEHLNAKMVLLEALVLQLTERHAAKGPTGGGMAYNEASYSRMPTFLTLIDRVMFLHSRLDEAVAGLAQAEPVSAPIPKSNADTVEGLGPAIEELEAHVQMLELDVGVTEAHPLDKSSPAAAILAACQRIEFVKDHSIRYLHKEIEALQQENQGMKTTLQHVRDELQQASAGGEEVERLRARAAQAEDATVTVRRQYETRIDELTAEVKARTEDAERFRALAEDSEARLREAEERNDADLEAHMTELDETTERFQSQLDTMRQKLDTQRELVARKDELLAVAEAEREELQSELAAARAQEPPDEALHRARAQLAQLKRDLASHEQHSAKVEEQYRVEFDRLTAQADSQQDGYEAILKAEMAAMKSAFEIKLSAAKQALAEQKTVATRAARELREELLEAKRRAA